MTRLALCQSHFPCTLTCQGKEQGSKILHCPQVLCARCHRRGDGPKSPSQVFPCQKKRANRLPLKTQQSSPNRGCARMQSTAPLDESVKRHKHVHRLGSDTSKNSNRVQALPRCLPPNTENRAGVESSRHVPGWGDAQCSLRGGAVARSSWGPSARWGTCS